VRSHRFLCFGEQQDLPDLLVTDSSKVLFFRWLHTNGGFGWLADSSSGREWECAK
jgi:hypothetical protein